MKSSVGLVLLPILGLALSACASGGGIANTSCAVISATGSCTIAEDPATPAAVPPSVTLFTETAATTYTGFGGSRQIDEVLDITGRRIESFKSQATTGVPGRQIVVTWDPRNANFRLQIQQPNAGLSVDDIYDDPLFRTAFGGARAPQAGTPNIPNFTYLQKGPLPTLQNEVVTFFYETPGTRTRFVTLAGYIRNSGVTEGTIEEPGQTLLTRERSAFVFGTPTPQSRVPTTGTASFTGGLLASAVYNIELDVDPTIRTRSEWIVGTSDVRVNFAQNSIDLVLSGAFTRTNDAFEATADGLIPGYNTSNGGRTFFASGRATFGTERTSFSGSITETSIGGRAIPVTLGTVAGSLFGSRAEEIGGNFRIIGGSPDQRIEIIGGFTGSK